MQTGWIVFPSEHEFVLYKKSGLKKKTPNLGFMIIFFFPCEHGILLIIINLLFTVSIINIIIIYPRIII